MQEKENKLHKFTNIQKLACGTSPTIFYTIIFIFKNKRTVIIEEKQKQQKKGRGLIDGNENKL